MPSHGYWKWKEQIKVFFSSFAQIPLPSTWAWPQNHGKSSQILAFLKSLRWMKDHNSDKSLLSGVHFIKLQFHNQTAGTTLLFVLLFFVLIIVVPTLLRRWWKARSNTREWNRGRSFVDPTSGQWQSDPWQLSFDLNGQPEFYRYIRVPRLPHCLLLSISTDLKEAGVVMAPRGIQGPADQGHPATPSLGHWRGLGLCEERSERRLEVTSGHRSTAGGSPEPSNQGATFLEQRQEETRLIGGPGKFPRTSGWTTACPSPSSRPWGH